MYDWLFFVPGLILTSISTIRLHSISITQQTNMQTLNSGSYLLQAVTVVQPSARQGVAAAAAAKHPPHWLLLKQLTHVLTRLDPLWLQTECPGSWTALQDSRMPGVLPCLSKQYTQCRPTPHKQHLLISGDADHQPSRSHCWFDDVFAMAHLTHTLAQTHSQQ